MIYIMVERINPQEFIEEVNEWIEKGFTPLGGVSTNGTTYVQAMVKQP